MGESKEMKKLVISGINLVDGGALSVFQDCMDTLVNSKYMKIYDVIILVGQKSLFEKYSDRVSIIEFKKSKKNWIYRLYYEYFYFKRMSKKIKADVWISLHDITPNVIAKKRYVYCHNPSPFNDMSFGEAKYGIKYYLFSKFYKYLYQININQNNAVIVQQDWIREKFKQMFNLNNVIVARPSIPVISQELLDISDTGHKIIFVFPSYPRYYKNFQSACEACKILHKKGITDFLVYITIDGSENLYAKELVEKYSEIGNIRFTGLLKRADLYDLYKKASCMIFMSKLETWGMPLIEFMTTNKSIIAANLPYAHETIGDYQNVAFADVNDYEKIAELMEKVIRGQILNEGNSYVKPEAPYAANWNELLDIIL